MVSSLALFLAPIGLVKPALGISRVFVRVYLEQWRKSSQQDPIEILKSSEHITSEEERQRGGRPMSVGLLLPDEALPETPDFRGWLLTPQKEPGGVPPAAGKHTVLVRVTLYFRTEHDLYVQGFRPDRRTQRSRD